MKITFLGTGTSYGVPFVGCDCAVCTSTNPRNQRLRASIFIETSSTRLLIDTTPDLRQQLLRENIRDFSAVLWTHWHNDHIIGLDDLRPISDRVGYLQGFADEKTVENLRRTFGYALDETRENGGVPRLKLRVAAPLETFEIGDISVTPIPIWHGKTLIYAYRLETEENGEHRVLVYATDCSQIPDASREMIKNADVLVLDALRHKPHPTHFSVGEALREIENLQPRRAFLTHIAHDLDCEIDNAKLPPNVQLAYDGLKVEIQPRKRTESTEKESSTRS